jgi:HK97 family phage portal protein
MTNNKFVFIGGKKAVDVWGDDPTGWTILSGEGASTSDASYFKFIPTLYRSVQLRSYSVSSMPFQLLSGKRVYDSSDDWRNKVGFMPNPFILLQLIESALVMAGKCYLFRERSQAGTKALKYHLPDSVRPEINKTTGEIKYFERVVNMQPKPFKVDDYVYFWLPDPYVEVGPPINFPAQAAANACGVLLQMDVFAANFFERGAIKAMLLTVSGMPAEAERQKLTEWWRRVVGGVKNAFSANVINAEAVKPVVVGEGVKELENVTIGEDKREDIAVALGVPMSILFSNAANYATSQQDEINFLNKTIIPDCDFIASILNEQLFTPLGLHFEFMPDTLDAMQEDEANRAASLVQLTNAGIPLLMAMDLLGYEMTDEQRAELEKAEVEKEQRAEEMAQQLASAPESEEETEEEPENISNDVYNDLKTWKRLASKAVKKGDPADFEFVTTIIPPPMYQTIITALGNAKTEADVAEAFTHTQTPAPKFSDPFMALAAELKRANDLLEKAE